LSSDETTAAYVKDRARSRAQFFQSDPDASDGDRMSLDVTNMEPQVACPHSPDNVKPLSRILGTKINVAAIGSCSNGSWKIFT